MAARTQRIALVGSGGGHVRQLLDMEPLWRDRDYFFVTEDTALGHSIAAQHKAFFVSHVALGQARLGAPFKMAAAAICNMIASFGIVRRQRPDFVITTGAGSCFFVVLWARLFGARIILVDSFARFRGPSAFARIAGPLAHVRIAQSDEAARHWKGARAFDPFRLLDKPRPPKKPLLFATVGATLPFYRLMSLVSTAKADCHVPENVLAQTGEGGIRPDNLEVVETLPFDALKEVVRDADIVVCHGGTGSLITALREGCRIIAVPRRFDRGEHYDDHQSEIVQAFVERGLIATADTPEEMTRALAQVRAIEPQCATTDPSALIDHIGTLLAQWAYPDDGRAVAR